MKRLLCLCIAVLLCFCFAGCQEVPNQPKALPKLYDWQAEIVDYEQSRQLFGTITQVLLPDALELEIDDWYAEKWGKKVYVITDEAGDFCVGDKVCFDFEQTQHPTDKSQYVRMIATRIWTPLPVYKPIIYFYPEVDTLCSAKLTLNGKLTCTYPAHGEKGWENFTAYPDGTLIFPDGKEYYALYWEGKQASNWDFSQGFCVPGEKTAEFLEWALSAQGLTPREANEFIVYWLPALQENPYNVISFQTDAYTDGAVLEITPAPDSLLRIFMAYYPSDVEIEIAPQTFAPFVRSGFTVVEWGGGPA